MKGEGTGRGERECERCRRVSKRRKGRKKKKEREREECPRLVRRKAGNRSYRTEQRVAGKLQQAQQIGGPAAAKTEANEGTKRH